MKIVELLNNVQLTLTNEQADLLGRFQFDDKILKDSLSEREQIIANQLTQQDVLLRKLNKEKGKITYSKKIR